MACEPKKKKRKKTKREADQRQKHHISPGHHVALEEIPRSCTVVMPLKDQKHKEHKKKKKEEGRTRKGTKGPRGFLSLSFFLSFQWICHLLFESICLKSV